MVDGKQNWNEIVKRTLLVLCVMCTAYAIGVCQTGSGISPNIVQFDPEHQPAIGLETPAVTAEVIAHAPDRETGSSRAIRLSFPGKVAEIVLPLPFQFNQVNAIRQGPAGKLIIVGMQSGYVYQIGILDSNVSRLIDRFTCYTPSISQDGQYIAFTKFFAPHFVTSVTDHSMLYVVARSAHENRPKGILLSDGENVGFEVFPPGRGNWETDNIDVAPGSGYSLSGEYIWKDRDQYFFADEVSGQFSLVWVSIKKASVSVRTATVPTREHVTGYAPPPVLENVDLTETGISATFTQPVLKRTFSRGDFGSAGVVNLASFPAGKP